MKQLLDRPSTVQAPELTNDHGWPQGLCVIEVSPGKYACNVADTKGLENPPQTDIHGLAVFASEASAILYTHSLKGLNGTVVAKSFEECRQIALSKPQLKALFLMDSDKIRDVLYVR